MHSTPLLVYCGEFLVGKGLFITVRRARSRLSHGKIADCKQSKVSSNQTNALYLFYKAITAFLKKIPYLE